MNQITLHLYIAIAISVSFVYDHAEAQQDLRSHCNDKMRELIQDSCKHLSRALRGSTPSRQRRSDTASRDTPSEVDTDHFFVEFLNNETIEETMLDRRRLYNVRRSSYPNGAHLIIPHHSAKMLHSFDPKYKIEQIGYHYESQNGRLMKSHTNRHRRNSKTEVIDKITGCCQTESACIAAMCFAKS